MFTLGYNRSATLALMRRFPIVVGAPENVASLVLAVLRHLHVGIQLTGK
jgi:hypothetical protein